MVKVIGQGCWRIVSAIVPNNYSLPIRDIRQNNPGIAAKFRDYFDLPLNPVEPTFSDRDFLRDGRCIFVGKTGTIRSLIGTMPITHPKSQTTLIEAAY